jgi:molybdenum cofactor cytidylyltransferase
MKADAVILAAGYSSRAGDFKPALDLCGKALLIRTIESMDGICGKVIVVAGHETERIKALLAEFPVTVVRNEHVEYGMFYSVKVGVRHVSASRFFILPGDQPAVRPSTFERLLKTEGTVVIPRYRGKKGHPVLFDGACAKEILALPDTEILRNYIHLADHVTVVDVDDPGVGMDVDTPEDYEKMKLYYRDVFKT